MKKILLASLFLFFFSPAPFSVIAQAKEPAVLTCETDGEFPPYRIITSGDPVGFEIDINDAIFRDSPYRLDYSHSTWDTSEIGETAASPEAVLFGWREINSATRQYMDFSEPVFFFRWGAFTRSDFPLKLSYDSLRTGRVGVIEKRFPYLNLQSRGIRNLSVFRDRTDAVHALSLGEIDVLFDEAISINYILIQQKLDKEMLYHPELEVTMPVGIGIRKGNSELLKFVNNRIGRLEKTGEYETLYEKHFLSHSPLYENQRRERAYKTAAGLVALFSVIGILLAFFYYRQLLHVAQEKAFADTLIENANSFILIWDENLNIVRSNTRIEEFLGYTKKELAGMKASDIIVMPGAIANYSLSMRMKPRAGNSIDVLWDINRFSRDDGKQRYMMAAGSDITEITDLRQSLETSLRHLQESEHRFELATSGGNVGIISCDIEKNKVYISPIGYKLFGYSECPTNLTNDEWQSWIHTSDIDIFQLNVFTVENAANVNPSSEIRIRGENGGYKWFLFSFKAQHDANGNMTILSGAFLDIDERKKMELLTRKLAFEDQVSGTRNRHYLMTEGEKILLQAQKNNLGVGLIIFDIDGFKLINMEKGMAAGDQLLREVGAQAKKFLGSVGLLARLSGDEFICLLPFDTRSGINDKLNAAMEALKASMREIDATKFGLKRITICEGSSVFPVDSTELSGLIENASVSLLAAKGQGPSSTKIYDSHVKNKTKREDILRRDIQNLIKNNQLVAYYQPKVDLSTGYICGAEALARWDHPEFGIIWPDYFIKMAEDIGVITALDSFLLRDVCYQNAKWQSLGLQPIRIAVNMSAEGFFSDKTIDFISGLLAETKLDPKWLEVELTESKAMTDIQKAINSMLKLRSLGVTISLDDFGTGYSSLNYMKRLPIKIIKLDRSFILDIESNPASQMIVNTLVQLAKKMNLSVTVEGVENPLQEMHLRSIGCEYAQGYLYSRPIPAAQFEDLLRSGKPLGRFDSY